MRLVVSARDCAGNVRTTACTVRVGAVPKRRRRKKRRYSGLPTPVLRDTTA